MALTKLGVGAFPSDTILQVKEGGRTTRFEGTGGTSFADCGVSVNITPSSTSSKILVRVSGTLAPSGSGAVNGIRCLVKLFRDSTEIGKSTADGTAANNSTGTFKPLNAGATTTTGRSQMWQVQFEVLDSPNTTSATTYKCQFAETHINAVIYVNRPFAGTDADQHGVISSITAMEVAA